MSARRLRRRASTVYVCGYHRRVIRTAWVMRNLAVLGSEEGSGTSASVSDILPLALN